MTSPVDLVNRALFEVGTRSTVSSIQPSDGSAEANAAAIIYQPTFNMLARAAHWNCLRKQATLTLLKAALGTPENPSGALPVPPQPWAYAYEYPPDCLKARFIVPIIGGPPVSPPFTTATQMQPPVYMTSGAVRFVISSDTDQNGNPITVVLTNLSQAQLVYTAQINIPDMWDAQFQEAMVAALAAKFAYGLARNAQLCQEKMKIADAIVVQARVTDGNEGLTSVDNLPDWMRARGVRGDFLGGGYYYCGWDAMSWGFGGGAF